MRKSDKFLKITIIVAIFSVIVVFIHNLKLDMKYSTTKQLSEMYLNNQEDFQNLADKLWLLWEDEQYGLTRIELDDNIYGCEVVKRWDDFYFGSHTELPNAIYQSLSEMLNPLVKEAGLKGLCMTEKQIEFSFDWTYGYASSLYCVRQADDMPLLGLTT